MTNNKAKQQEIDDQLRTLKHISDLTDKVEEELNQAREDAVVLKREITHRPMADVLLARKHKTKVGFYTIRLEKLLLQIDGVDSLGGVETIRSARKAAVRRTESLLALADETNQDAKQLVALHDQMIEKTKQEQDEVL